MAKFLRERFIISGIAVAVLAGLLAFDAHATELETTWRAGDLYAPGAPLVCATPDDARIIALAADGPELRIWMRRAFAGYRCAAWVAPKILRLETWNSGPHDDGTRVSSVWGVSYVGKELAGLVGFVYVPDAGGPHTPEF